jgi:hypothetical protein
MQDEKYYRHRNGERQFLFQSTDEMLDEASRLLDVEAQQFDFGYFDAEPRSVLTKSDVERMGLPEWLAQKGL